MQGLCTPGTLTSFEHVADNVISATITGNSRARFEGRTVACAVVKARYRVIPDLMVPPILVLKLGRVSRTMCIDRARKLILSDHMEADMDAGPLPDHIDQTVSYDRIERNPDLPASLFEFHPPEGATLFVPLETPKVPAAPPAPAAPVPSPNLNTMPEPISRVEPEYSQEAWDEGIQGTVILVADIEPDGAISRIQVQQSIGYGLDEKATECVRKWRFRPAVDGGRPVKGVVEARLNFSLPPNRPAQPSAGPVSRSVPPPRLPIVELKAPSDLDEFFYLVAVNLKAPALCGKIDPMAGSGGAGMERRGYQIQTIQSECYTEVAAVLHDPKLCEYVKPVRTDVYDGSKLDKAECLSQLPGPTTSPIPDVYSLQPAQHAQREVHIRTGASATRDRLCSRVGADRLSQVRDCEHGAEAHGRRLLDLLPGAGSHHVLKAGHEPEIEGQSARQVPAAYLALGPRSPRGT